MSDHGINVTYKAGTGYDEHWITVGADDLATWEQRNEAVVQAIADKAAHTAATVRALSAVARGGILPTPPDGGGTAGQVQAASPVVTQQDVSSTPAPSLAVVAGGIPQGISIWTGPQANNPQYDELFISGVSFPLQQALKAEIAGPRGHKFQSGKSSFLKFNGKGEPLTTHKQNETLVRNFIAANAHLQGA